MKSPPKVGLSYKGFQIWNMILILHCDTKETRMLCTYCKLILELTLGLLFLQVILALGDYMSVQCHACIGGTNVGEDIRKLDYGQHVVSGTPGRVSGKQANFFYMMFCNIDKVYFHQDLAQDGDTSRLGKGAVKSRRSHRHRLPFP